MSMRGRLALLALATGLAIPGAAEAQPPRPVRIGVLTESWGPTPQVAAMRNALQELGYREEVDFTLGVRFTQGNPAELPAAARDLVRMGAGVIVTGESANSVEAARTATDRIPIVFMGGSDPVSFGLVKSLARPGGNVTGIADLDIELVPKRMELFREIVPGLKRVLLVYDSANAYTEVFLRVYRDAARRLGLTLVERPVRTQEEARNAITSVRRSQTDGILSPRFLSLNIPGFMLDPTIRDTIPTMFHAGFLVERGGLASYAASLEELGRQAAKLIDKILKGAKPAELPVEQPTKFELVINLKTAKALGLALPSSLLLRADRIIE